MINEGRGAVNVEKSSSFFSDEEESLDVSCLIPAIKVLNILFSV